MTRRGLGLGAMAGLALDSGAAHAQASGPFPNRPIRMIVPWPAGGATDIQMRTMCEIASRRLGQPVIVENKTGASGTMGAITLAGEQRADGYLLSQMGLAVFRNPLMSQRPIYDPMRDFTWIIHVTGYLAGIAVRADAPWQNLQELFAHIRANPGRVNYGSPGVGSASHVTMEEIAQREHLDWVHIPFRGAPDNIQALLKGETQFLVESSAWAPLVEAGQLRLLATFGSERAKRFPNVPTLQQAGVDIVGDQPYGIAGPRGMDPRIVQILHDALKEALYDPAHVAVLDRYDMPLLYADSEEYARRARAQYEADRVMIRALGLRMD
ncbi:tripartite tricarboxylate transporter substrate binding protein [Muricoccus radiodurans]|uniref:tripartite tricarboxylate transporter substrate binding protein n=1 Tax=Muricoccus radiodurans TaxID=2231721 RepID=UPI003CE98A31